MNTGATQSLCRLVVLAGVMFAGLSSLRARAETQKTEHAVSYYNDVVPAGPWSIHVVRIQRARHDFQFTTSLGLGNHFGMATVSEQLARLAPACGKPIASINGDFYVKSEKYAGRPRDLQIVEGEIVSGPAGHTCFWMDIEGVPHMTNVFSKFQITWPDGRVFPFALNEERLDDSAVLFTPAVGRSTRTSGGMELTLAPISGKPALPIGVGREYEFQVKNVSHEGDSVITSTNLVLSLGPRLAETVHVPPTGALIRISTRTFPDLDGCKVAIGGGPALVRNRQLMHWDGFFKMRHPRTALGWNQEHIFLVEVDGRQSNLSVGMTFPELADYMLKIGCDDALNLDGGGSSTLWFLGSVRNSPSEGDERPAANALVLVKRQGATNSTKP